MWSSLDDVRAAIATEEFKPLARRIDPRDPAHLKTLLAITDEELAAAARRDRIAWCMGAAAIGRIGAGDFPGALRYFDALAGAGPSDLSIFANALYAVCRVNNKLAPMPERARTYLAKALPRGPKNPFIFYNAIGVALELDDRATALQCTRDAVRFGFPDLKLMQSDTQLPVLRDDPEFAGAFTDADLLAERATWIVPPALVAIRELAAKSAWTLNDVDLELGTSFETPDETRDWLDGMDRAQPRRSCQAARVRQRRLGRHRGLLAAELRRAPRRVADRLPRLRGRGSVRSRRAYPTSWCSSRPRSGLSRWSSTAPRSLGHSASGRPRSAPTITTDAPCRRTAP